MRKFTYCIKVLVNPEFFSHLFNQVPLYSEVISHKIKCITWDSFVTGIERPTVSSTHNIYLLYLLTIPTFFPARYSVKL